MIDTRDATAPSAATNGESAATRTPRAPRVQWADADAAAVRAQYGMEAYVRTSGLERELVELVKLRASYLNGCAYCVDMHSKDARAGGEREQRIFAIPVWRETPFFTPRERAALAWTEAVTAIGGGVSDELFEDVSRHFSRAELVRLTMAVVTINGWNRFAIAFAQPVGEYVAGSAARQFAAFAGAAAP